jgi:NUMOD4 motif
MNYGDFEQRSIIPDFPRYEVSNFGKVYNIKTGREMVLSPTLQGILTVGLMEDNLDGYPNRQYRRSVKRLVAEAFVPGETDLFDTPIQLDGDNNNLRADNIVWRPRWFAWRYFHQFYNLQPWHHSGPVVDIVNDIEYESIFVAGITTGSLFKDIRYSIHNEGYLVFPGGEMYKYTNLQESQPL